MDALTWRRSSHSGANGGDCVEVASFFSVIGLRDSKNPTTAHLTIDRPAFAALIKGLKA